MSSPSTASPIPNLPGIACRTRLRQQPPANVKLHHSLATKDGTRAACLWGAPSAPALKHMLDQTLAGVGENECREVENAEGIGLPSNLLPQVGAAGNAERNIALVKSAYVAFLRGDIEGAIADLDEDVDWQPVLGVADFVPIAGKYKGRVETRRFFALVGQHIHFDSFEPREFIGRGDRVIALGSYAGGPKSGAKSFACQWVMAFRLRIGKVRNPAWWPSAYGSRKDRNSGCSRRK